MQRQEAAGTTAHRAVLGRDLLNRLVVFALLAAFIGAVYSAVVVGLGTAVDAEVPSTGLSIVATSAVALAFARVRRRAQRLANRITFGERSMPEEVLARFSALVAASDAPEELLPRMARTVADGTGAASAEVWVAVDDALVLAASWPEPARRAPRLPFRDAALPAFPRADRVAAVRHHDELLGAITIAKRPGDQVTNSEASLLSDVASQAGLALRNVRLTADLAARLAEIEGTAAELRASRQRIVEAQDAERRRLERDIHDGAQQHLVALAVKLRMARTLAEREPARAARTLADVRALIDRGLEDLRDLTRGIYPPVLVERGIVPALRAQAKRAGIRATVSARTLGRFDRTIEAAVYFCCLEAIQNAVKHGARRVAIRLQRDGTTVAFSVLDDGPGFDPAAVRRGAGLHNMGDRIAAVGGELEIRSILGEGTTIAARVPVGARERTR